MALRATEEKGKKTATTGRLERERRGLQSFSSTFCLFATLAAPCRRASAMRDRRQNSRARREGGGGERKRGRRRRRRRRDETTTPLGLGACSSFFFRTTKKEKSFPPRHSPRHLLALSRNYRTCPAPTLASAATAVRKTACEEAVAAALCCFCCSCCCSACCCLSPP